MFTCTLLQDNFQMERPEIFVTDKNIKTRDVRLYVVNTYKKRDVSVISCDGDVRFTVSLIVVHGGGHTKSMPGTRNPMMMPYCMFFPRSSSLSPLPPFSLPYCIRNLSHGGRTTTRLVANQKQVPRLWAFTITGDEFSWILPTLGLWFSSLITRDEQDRAWLNNGRPTCYWLTGFFNPQVLKINLSVGR